MLTLPPLNNEKWHLILFVSYITLRSKGSTNKRQDFQDPFQIQTVFV